MSANVVNQVAYLRTSRQFPADLNQLALENNKAYIDTSNAVNSRTIGIFPTTRPAINGEAWYVSNNQKQQGFRQIYPFTTNANISLGFKIASISQFTKCSGAFTDGTNWYGVIFGSNVAIAGQLSFYIALDGTSTTSDLITFGTGAGAPTITSGTIVIEWISDV